jgi:hypothetical protein
MNNRETHKYYRYYVQGANETGYKITQRTSIMKRLSSAVFDFLLLNSSTQNLMMGMINEPHRTT